jgi:hypothetical protein
MNLLMSSGTCSLRRRRGGTLLLDQGLPAGRPKVCSDPDRVRAIHRDYVAAGARVIEQIPLARMQTLAFWFEIA